MNNTLSLDDLKINVPAIFAQKPDPKVSSRYNFANSSVMLEKFVDSGWQIASAKQVSRSIYAPHQVVLRHADFSQVGDCLPQIHFSNSHDGTSKMNIGMGIFRLVCSNGLVVPTTSVESISIKHNDLGTDLTKVITDDFYGKIPALFGKMELMQNRILDTREINEFAERAIDLRFEGLKNRVSVDQMVNPWREEDDVNNLWTVFNVLQEKVIKGGVRVGDRNRTARPINNFINSNKMNIKLWEIAEEYLV
jgi:hypothetical protein